MSVQINYYQQFPFRVHNAPVAAPLALSAREATRLWWLPRYFEAEVDVQSPYGDATFTLSQSNGNRMERQLSGGWGEDVIERNLCYPGLDGTPSGAVFQADQDFGTESIDMSLTLFKPTSSASSGVWADGDDYEVVNVVSADIILPDVTAFLTSYPVGGAPEGTSGLDFKAQDVDLIFNPPPSQQPPYTRPTTITTYIEVSTGDAADWTVTVTIEEVGWFEHGGLWLPTAGTDRLREP